MASSSHTYDAAKNLTANGFTKTGYVFAGWATSTTGAIVYSNSQSVSNLTTTNGGTVNLYANWTVNAPITFNITTQSGTGISATTGTGAYNSGTTATVGCTVQSCYTFDGWYDGNTKVSSSQSYNFTVTAARTLQARATPINYTILTSSSPSAGGTTNGGGSYACGTPRTVTAAVNNNYTFLNWTENGSIVSTNASYIFTVSGNRTLVANFTQVVSPTVTTQSATNITQTSATIDYTVTAGTEAITERGVKYTKTGEGILKTATGGNATGRDFIILTGLSKDTEYSFYAYATTASGTGAVSDILTFRTLVDGTNAVETIDADKFTVYPNPAQNEIFIKSAQPIKKVEILDISGRIVISTGLTTVGVTEYSQSINLSHLPKGFYFVKILIGNQSITKKIIKK
jgi:uncharacterized repeat protein (TIGR02543 family)